MQHDHLMASMTQVAQGRQRQLTVEQEIGDEHHEPAAGEQRREAHQGGLRCRPSTVRRVDKAAHQSRPLSRLHSRGHYLAHNLVERDEPGGVALSQQD